jgi:hypothetical protein
MKAVKFILTASLVLLFNHSIFSQRLQPGIIAGASLNNMKLENVPQMDRDLSSINGIEGGLYLRINAGSFYVKPMVVASYLKGKVSRTVDEIVIDETSFQLSTLEVPVIAGLKLLPFISLEAGPAWNYIMNYTETVNGYQLNLNRHSLGYRAGVNVSISRVSIFGHYGGIIETGSDTGYQLDRPSRIIFGLSYDLVKKK